METFKVYITQNLLYPEKAYVGMTKKTGKALRNYYGTDKDLLKDIEELGKHNFSKTILGEFADWRECHYWEGFYVKTFKTHVSQGGYNKHWNGGQYWHHSKETMQKIIKKLTGKKRSKESIEKYKEAAQKRESDIKIKIKRLKRSHSKKATEKRVKSYKETCSTPESKKKKSEAGKRNWQNPEYRAKIMDPENRKKIGEGRRGKPMKTRTCPYCGLTGRGSNMLRYHFYNCKKYNG